jgi:hypothetical protein
MDGGKYNEGHSMTPLSSFFSEMRHSVVICGQDVFPNTWPPLKLIEPKISICPYLYTNYCIMPLIEPHIKQNNSLLKII